MSATTSAAPFDAIAPDYDQTFSSSTIGRAQRAAVWRELATAFQAGDRVLEIGCGTGIDACFLAKRGVRVFAFDSSPEMISITTRKASEQKLEHLVQASVLRAEDIGSLARDAFDGAFSNFGALNCVEDLRHFAQDLARLLKPGATAMLCFMGPYCLWEIVWYLTRGNTRKAFRRRHRSGVTARIADGVLVHVRYPNIGELEHAFAPLFRVTSIKGIGVTVPPSYVEPWAQRHPSWVSLCERVDSFLGYCPGIRMLADHTLVQLRRQNTNQ